MFTITEPLVRKLLATVDAGLVKGVGIPEPGKMCVEAAISYALGEPHSDGPSCRPFRIFQPALSPRSPRLSDENCLPERQLTWRSKLLELDHARRHIPPDL